MLGDLGIEQFAPMSLETCQRASLVLRHETAVTNDIGRQNGCQLTLTQRALHAIPSPVPILQKFVAMRHVRSVTHKVAPKVRTISYPPAAIFMRIMLT